MGTVVERILKRYGSRITLSRPSGQCLFRGFLHHTGSHSWQNMRRNYSPLGTLPGGQYVLLAPVEPMLEEGDLLLLDGSRYRIRQLEKEAINGTKLCQWGLCEREGGETV